MPIVTEEPDPLRTAGASEQARLEGRTAAGVVPPEPEHPVDAEAPKPEPPPLAAAAPASDSPADDSARSAGGAGDEQAEDGSGNVSTEAADKPHLNRAARRRAAREERAAHAREARLGQAPERNAATEPRTGPATEPPSTTAPLEAGAAAPPPEPATVEAEDRRQPEEDEPSPPVVRGTPDRSEEQDGSRRAEPGHDRAASAGEQDPPVAPGAMEGEPPSGGLERDPAGSPNASEAVPEPAPVDEPVMPDETGSTTEAVPAEPVMPDETGSTTEAVPAEPPAPGAQEYLLPAPSFFSEAAEDPADAHPADEGRPAEDAADEAPADPAGAASAEPDHQQPDQAPAADAAAPVAAVVADEASPAIIDVEVPVEVPEHAAPDEAEGAEPGAPVEDEAGSPVEAVDAADPGAEPAAAPGSDEHADPVDDAGTLDEQPGWTEGEGEGEGEQHEPGPIPASQSAGEPETEPGPDERQPDVPGEGERGAEELLADGAPEPPTDDRSAGRQAPDEPAPAEAVPPAERDGRVAAAADRDATSSPDAEQAQGDRGIPTGALAAGLVAAAGAAVVGVAALAPTRSEGAAKAAGPASTLLIVCHANVCRSPLAQRVLQRALASGPLREVVVLSAGTEALVGAPMCELSAARLGTEDAGFAAAHRAAQLQPEQIRAADLVLTADRELRSAVVRMAPGTQAKVFTWREAVALGEVAEQRIRDELATPAGDLRGVAPLLHAMRGQVVFDVREERRRGLFGRPRLREPDDPLSVPDGHSADARAHERTTGQAAEVAEQLGRRLQALAGATASAAPA